MKAEGRTLRRVNPTSSSPGAGRRNLSPCILPWPIILPSKPLARTHPDHYDHSFHAFEEGREDGFEAYPASWRIAAEG